VLFLVSPFLVHCVLEKSCDIDEPIHRAEGIENTHLGHSPEA